MTDKKYNFEKNEKEIIFESEDKQTVVLYTLFGNTFFCTILRDDFYSEFESYFNFKDLQSINNITLKNVDSIGDVVVYKTLN